MAKPSSSPGYKTTAETCDLLGRTQPCVLGYIRDGQLTGEKGADGHWYISELSINAFLQRRNLTSGARALTELDAMEERVVQLEAALDAVNAQRDILAARIDRLEQHNDQLKHRLDRLSAGMNVMLVHLKKVAVPVKED